MTEKKGEFVPAQKFIGMQVIDSKGSTIGTVRDLGINVVEKKFNLIVTTRMRTDLQVSWEDIQSVVDVVLLRKEIELPKVAEAVPTPLPPPPTSACPNCGTSVIPTARFCPKCGSKLR
jgi:sporulation protein YlmC with PRC-barrel domain